MNFIKYRSYFLLIVLTVLIPLFFWFLFYKNIPAKIGFPDTKLETIFANYDGPNYMVITKCGYQKSCIGPSFSLPQPLEYYPAHLPGFPLLIKYLSFYTTTPKAMLLATLLGSVLFTIFSYKLFSLYLSPKSAFYLTTILQFFPARLLALHLVGAPETWFIGSIVASIFFFKKNNFFVSALFAVLAQTLKSPAILLFAAYGLIFLVNFFKTKKIDWRFSWYMLVPATVLVIFAYYQQQTGDFWAYFHSGDNFHLNPWPYLVFISNHTWINTIWLEDVVYIYLLAFYGVYRLWKKYKFDIITVFPSLFVLATVLVAHRDISRYIAPVYPFLFLAFSRVMTKKPFKIIIAVLIPALILYVINFLIGNTAPIADWTPYL